MTPNQKQAIAFGIIALLINTTYSFWLEPKMLTDNVGTEYHQTAFHSYPVYYLYDAQEVTP